MNPVNPYLIGVTLDPEARKRVVRALESALYWGRMELQRLDSQRPLGYDEGLDVWNDILFDLRGALIDLKSTPPEFKFGRPHGEQSRIEHEEALAALHKAFDNDVRIELQRKLAPAESASSVKSELDMSED